MKREQYYFRKDGKLAIRIAGQEEAIVNIDSIENKYKVERLMEIMGQQGQIQAFCRHLSEARKKNPEAWESDGMETGAFVALTEQFLSEGPAQKRFDEKGEEAMIGAYKDDFNKGSRKIGTTEMSGAYKDDFDDNDDEDDVR